MFSLYRCPDFQVSWIAGFPECAHVESSAGTYVCLVETESNLLCLQLIHMYVLTCAYVHTYVRTYRHTYAQTNSILKYMYVHTYVCTYNC